MTEQAEMLARLDHRRDAAALQMPAHHLDRARAEFGGRNIVAAAERGPVEQGFRQAHHPPVHLGQAQLIVIFLGAGLRGVETAETAQRVGAVPDPVAHIGGLTQPGDIPVRLEADPGALIGLHHLVAIDHIRLGARGFQREAQHRIRRQRIARAQHGHVISLPGRCVGLGAQHPGQLTGGGGGDDGGIAGNIQRLGGDDLHLRRRMPLGAHGFERFVDRMGPGRRHRHQHLHGRQCGRRIAQPQQARLRGIVGALGRPQPGLGGGGRGRAGVLRAVIAEPRHDHAAAGAELAEKPDQIGAIGGERIPGRGRDITRLHRVPDAHDEVLQRLEQGLLRGRLAAVELAGEKGLRLAHPVRQAIAELKPEILLDAAELRRADRPSDPDRSASCAADAVHGARR